MSKNSESIYTFTSEKPIFRNLSGALTTSFVIMHELNLPAFDIKLSVRKGRQHLYDPFRKSWVALTPEEWVRQNFLMWLVRSLGFPPGLIAVEVSLTYNNLKKRADAVVYDKYGNPVVLIECKAPSVKITQETADQAIRYNVAYRAPYLMLTNGLDHFCCQVDFESGRLLWMENIPDYALISSE